MDATIQPPPGEHLNNLVATNIRMIAAARKLSQRDLALAADMGGATISRKLNGGRDFTLGELERLAGALNVSPSLLMRDIGARFEDAA